ncbi:hypothetical protein SK128_011039, partial [Halocaridina rubra]
MEGVYALLRSTLPSNILTPKPSGEITSKFESVLEHTWRREPVLLQAGSMSELLEKIGVMKGQQLMAPSTRHRGVRRISKDRVDSTIGLRADTPGGSNGSACNLAPPNTSASFTLHYSNIPGLNSNHSSVKQHL